MPFPLRLTPLVLFSATALSAQNPDHRALERDILKQLVEINTSDSARHTDQAAKAMQDRLAQAGIPAKDMQVIETGPGIENLVVRYRGSGNRREADPVDGSSRRGPRPARGLVGRPIHLHGKRRDTTTLGEQ